MQKLLTSFLTLGSLLINFPAFSQTNQPLINELMSLNTSTIEDADGDSPDWIEIYNPTAVAIKMGNYYLTDDSDDLFKWKFSNVEIAAKGFLIVYASGKYELDHIRYSSHTNFKIDSDREDIFLTSAGNIIDNVFISKLRADVSTGRSPDGGTAWKLFSVATPQKSNTTTGYIGFTDQVSVSVNGGFYSSTQKVNLTVKSSKAVIRYTLNGADPDQNSTSYTGTITISKTKVLKCRAFETNMIPSPVLTNTYFINVNKSLPVISLSTDPDNLFDNDIGIYVNYFEEWERPVHIEFFEPDKTMGFSSDAGMKMFGKTSRNSAQKSFALFARDSYGNDEFDYKLFPNLDISSFKLFVLRNAGSDNIENHGAVHFRDELTATLVRSVDLEKQAYRPSVVYINGEYWGIYNIREKVTEDFLASHFKIEPDKIDLLDDYHTLYPIVVEGSADNYNSLIDFLISNTPADESIANDVATQMDVSNFVSYMAIQIYLANQDGPGHNCKFWREQIPGGKFRWILYDTDHSYGLKIFLPNIHYDPLGYMNNTLAYYREENGPSWPNPPESTFMFRKILENEKFKNLFINRVADFLNSIFSEDVVLNTIDSISNIIEPEMDEHTDRWGSSKSEWFDNVEVVRDFARYRPDYLRDIVISEFDLSGTTEINLMVSPENTGGIQINSLTINENNWSGTYFKGVPVQLKALPKPGYKFVGWTGIDAINPEVTLTPSKDITITARFEIDENYNGVKYVYDMHSISPFYPNPFADKTTLEFRLNIPQQVMIKVYGMLGNEITTLANQRMSSGKHLIQWDGTNSSGKTVGEGLYFIKLIVDKEVYSQKVMKIGDF
jgi:uncharacterized repeat protein (TIGR02543 family)